MVTFTNFQAKAKSFFPSRDYIQKYSEVALFISELLKDPLPVGYNLYQILDTAYKPTRKNEAVAFHEKSESTNEMSTDPVKAVGDVSSGLYF